jgi:hypothetical protein
LVFKTFFSIFQIGWIPTITFVTNNSSALEAQKKEILRFLPLYNPKFWVLQLILFSHDSI